MRHCKLFKTLFILFVAGAFVSCNNSKSTEVIVNEKAKVNVKQVLEQDVEQLGTFTATVTGQITNNISPKIGMRIDDVIVEVGDHVKKGQVIAKMDASSLVQAKLQMVNDSIEFVRTDELYKVGGNSKSEWDARRLAYNISKTNYNNLLENTMLISPINGVVTARNYDDGDMFSLSQPLYVVEQIRPVKLKVNVSEGLYTKIKKGMLVDVQLDVFGDEIFKGKISLVYPSLDPATRTFPVEVLIANGDERVRPGMFARVTFFYGVRKHVVVPDVSIVKQTGSGDRYIYTVVDGKIEFKKVELGRRMDTQYEIISGVNSGDMVVIGGHNRLTNGMEVEIAK
ncbi:MAG: efflux RND transporter periplasmic adaptor subunit [Bacteroidales bacterium]